MLTSVGEYWFLALAVPLLIAVLLIIINKQVSRFYSRNDYKITLAKPNKKSSLYNYIFISIRKLFALSVILLPIYFSYLIFSVGHSIELIINSSQSSNHRIALENGFIFYPAEHIELYQLFSKLGIGRNINSIAFNNSPNKYSINKITESIKQFESSEQDQRLIINASNQTIYIEQHFYTNENIKPMSRKQITPHSMVAVPYGFFSPLYVGCRSRPPERYTTDGVTKAADSFLLQVTEVPIEYC